MRSKSNKKRTNNNHPTNRKTLLGQSRALDNHFDDHIHHHAWITAGKAPDNKYNYGDSGLGMVELHNPKLKHYKMKY